MDGDFRPVEMSQVNNSYWYRGSCCRTKTSVMPMSVLLSLENFRSAN